MTAIFQIYGLFDPVNGELRYIGQTKSGLKNRLNKHCSSQELSNGTHKSNWLSLMKQAGRRPEIGLIEEAFSEREADEIEKFWISYFRSLGSSLLT